MNSLPKGVYQVWEIFWIPPKGDYRHRKVVQYLTSKEKALSAVNSQPGLRMQRKLAVVLDGIPWLLATVRPVRGVVTPDGRTPLPFDNTDTNGYTSEVEGPSLKVRAALLQSSEQWRRDYSDNVEEGE